MCDILKPTGRKRLVCEVDTKNPLGSQVLEEEFIREQELICVDGSTGNMSKCIETNFVWLRSVRD